MDLASSQPGRSLDIRPDQRLSPADSPFGVASTFAAMQHISGVPDKSIGQRGCKVNWFDDTDSDCSASENIDATNGQPEPEPETDDDDSSWQVVTRRKSRSKRDKPETVAPYGRCGDARAINGACEKSVSAGRLPATSSAASGVTTRQNHGLQLCRNDSISLSSHASCWYWPLCINSFVLLSKVDWPSFHAAMEKSLNRCPQTKMKRDDFLHFHHMMTEGPQAIRRVGDAVFLVCPFKVLMSEDVWSSDALLLSLVFDRIVPGFLTTLGGYFVNSLTGVKRKSAKLFRAITELLNQICQEDEEWLYRMGWQKMSMRNRCNLFSALAYLFKHNDEQDSIRNLLRKVSGSWLEKHYYATVQRISYNTEHKDPKGDLLDLRANVRAVFSWLEAQIFSVGKPQERPGLIDRYADICDALLVAIDSLAPPPNALLYSLWLAVGQWSHRFRMCLSQYLEFDRGISLLDKLLKKIDRWPDLDPLAFELRLSLLGFVLRKCEDLMCRRNAILFCQVWYEYQKKLELLLAECNRFMADYHPPFADKESDYAQLKEDARLNLKLKESIFYRLDCEIGRSSPQCIQENLQECHIAFESGWNLQETYREVGSIELAKWYFLAGKYDAGVSTLTNVSFNYVKLSTKKAELLARYGQYHSAVAEFHHIKALMRKSGETDRRKRDKVDNRLAMTQLQWHLAGDGTDHLIEAYRLSVDLLGRCDVQDRENFEGVLSHIVNTMKNSGLRFEAFAGQTSVLGYLVQEGGRIKSWHHLANLLYTRHKMRLTSTHSVGKLADEIGMKCGYFPGREKMS